MEQPVLNLLGHSCFHATEPWARELSLISSLQPKPCEDTVWFSCCRGEVLCPCLAVGSAHLKVAQAGFLGIPHHPWMFPTLGYCSSASRIGVFQVLLTPGIPEGWLPPEGRKVSWLFPSQGALPCGETVWRNQENELCQKLPHQPQGESRVDLDLTAAQSSLAWEE